MANDDLKKFAHSLGTSVAHDAPHALWTTEFAGGVRIDPADVKAAFVMMVANVSRLLQTDADVLTSAVQTGQASNPERGCLNFLTARHALDPFTIPRMFDPMEWPDEETVNQGRYQSIRVNHFRDRNIHWLRALPESSRRAHPLDAPAGRSKECGVGVGGEDGAEGVHRLRRPASGTGHRRVAAARAEAAGAFFGA